MQRGLFGRVSLVTGLGLSLLGAGCGGDDAGSGGDAADDPSSAEADADADADGGPEPWEAYEPEVAWPTLECDELVPEYCAYPFPSNVFSEPAPSTPTGRRLALTTSTTLRSGAGAVTDPEPWNLADGFSAGIPLTTLLPGATEAGLVTIDDPAGSLEPDSPTVVIDAETGRRILHFAELDFSHDQADRRALMIRPLERLEDGRRYIVGVRGVVDAAGAPIPAGTAFAALRDGTESGIASVEARRGLYADIFTRLRDAGVTISELQIAWDFTTASLASNTGGLLKMRDEALALAEREGFSYEIVNVVDDPDPEIAHRITVRFSAPRYTVLDGPGTRLNRGPDGLPERAGQTEVEVLVLIPKSALISPRPLLQYGHGLLGGKGELNGGNNRSFADQYGYVMFAVDWQGMATADVATILVALNGGEFHEFAKIGDRLHQGLLNSLLAMRFMATAFAADPTYGGFIDPSRRFYWGISQGGIFGGTYLATSTDVERGCLSVPGQPYALLLNRSSNFTTYLQIARQTWPDPLDRQHMISLAQMIWDRTEPHGYTHHLEHDPLPGTPSHQALVRIAVGDHQVTHWGGHLMARAIGARHLDTKIRPIHGLTPEPLVVGRSAVVEYDFGLPPAPIRNLPMTECDDPHGKLRSLSSAREQLHHFFSTGEARSFCPEAGCWYPELSGCP